MILKNHQINTFLLIRKNESNRLSRHELILISFHVFSREKQFFRDNIDDIREQNQIQKK